MPALDDQIDDLLDTYFYHVTTPERWEQISKEGLRPDTDGIIPALTTNHPAIVNHYAARHLEGMDIVVIRFNPCNLGIYPEKQPDNLSLPYENYMMEIRTSVIGPLLLEKEKGTVLF
ncbi:MAG: hypothetical protein C0394_10115 [Syntrophus sp. (in: bacteria)]|nr:hypothetical protein [Syntrophus sp. (in: bacteria)]